MSNFDAQCIFCKIIRKQAPADVTVETPKMLIFTPLKPYTPGHLLAIPKTHLKNFATNPVVAGDFMSEVSNWLWNKGQFNILTSIGPDATQTVMHFHVHIIPRGPEDGLNADWPWRRDLIVDPLAPYTVEWDITKPIEA